jgi:hypothetical protein
MPSSYQVFVKSQMSGKKFKSRSEANQYMKSVAVKWKSHKKDGGSLFGDIAGEVLSGASNVSRKYL